MRFPFSYLLVVLAACSLRPAVSGHVPSIDEPLALDMRRLADVECPRPPLLYALTGDWYEGYSGVVVGIDANVLAIRMEAPGEWPRDVVHLLMPVSGQDSDDGIKGNAVVVGRRGDILICRYFPSRWRTSVPVGLGDEAWVDDATSYEMRDSWQRGAR